MSKMTLPDLPQEVQGAIAPYPAPALDMFHRVRRYIYEEGARLDVGALQETLKWGEPSYLTPKSKAGSTLRIGWSAKQPGLFSLYVNCQTDLLARMSERFPFEFAYTGRRQVSMPLDAEPPEFALRPLVSMALNYHRDRAAAQK